MQRIKRFIPESLRRRSGYFFLGYDYAKIASWAGSLGELKKPALQSAYECLRFENLPYFKKGVFSFLWQRPDKNDGLIKAVDNYLYGELLEKNLLGNWQTTSPEDQQAEQNMVRVLNESILHAVRFCGLWTKAYEGKGYGDEFAMRRLAQLLGQCPGRPLDLPSGGMPFYPVIREREGWVCSDLSLQSLRIMRYVLNADPSHLFCHDAQVIPFPDQSFHVVTSRYVIENLLRPEDLLSEVFRILCPGGSFLLAIPSVAFQRNVVRYFTNRSVFPSREEFSGLCEKAGFQLERYYSGESVYHLKKPGSFNEAVWASGLQCPDSACREYQIKDNTIQFADGHHYPCIDEIPVLIPSKFIYAGFGRLGGTADL